MLMTGMPMAPCHHKHKTTEIIHSYPVSKLKGLYSIQMCCSNFFLNAECQNIVWSSPHTMFGIFVEYYLKETAHIC